MFIYEKKLEFPVKIKQTNPKLASLILTQFGGPDGELGASLRYFSQKFDMITPQAIAVLNDIGTEEPAHNSYHHFISYSLNSTLYLYFSFQAQLSPQ